MNDIKRYAQAMWLLGAAVGFGVGMVIGVALMAVFA